MEKPTMWFPNRSPIRVAKTKALISFAVTAKLICAFVFAYADCWFSHGAAHMLPVLGAHFFHYHYQNTPMQYIEFFFLVVKMKIS